jgi:hypothetical protein
MFVLKVWRRSWNRKSSIPAARQAVWKERLISRIGLPWYVKARSCFRCLTFLSSVKSRRSSPFSGTRRGSEVLVSAAKRSM